MSESIKQGFELEELLLRILSDEATQAEIALLNRSLIASPELRAEACQFLRDDSLLDEMFTTQREAADVVSELLEGNPIGSRSEIVPQEKALLLTVFDQINRHGFAIAALSAVLIMGLYLYSSSLNTKLTRLHRLAIAEVDEQGRDQGLAKEDGEASGDRTAEVIGRVAGMIDPIWKAESPPLGFGDRVRSGQIIELESGVLELLLSTGAKVTIEGPATFEALSTLESSLSRGKLAAAAPRMARGYTVITPTAELVDIGTQFGVVVEDSGDSELHVFDGDVVARSRLAVDGADLLHAKQDEAMRFSAASIEPQRIEAREREFIRNVAPRYASNELPPLPMTEDLCLWYAADMCQGVDEGERVGTWSDLLIGDNDFADNAWQFEELHRPVLVKDGAGRRALGFDGWSTFMSTSPMEPAEQQTIFIVCMRAPVTYSNSQFLLWYGDTPSLEISLKADSSVLGWVWPGPNKSCVGEIRSSPLGDQQPSLIAYQYDTLKNHSQLWVNGIPQGTAEAPVAVMKSGQKFIGRHQNPGYRTNFFGNLYEVVVYDRAIEAGQMQDFWDYFSQRYKLK